MPQHADALSAFSLPALRGIAAAYFPGQGSSRMARAQFVSWFLSQMVEEEVQTTAYGSRRGGSGSLGEATYLSHTKMRQRYGTDLFQAYMDSSARRSDARVHNRHPDPCPSRRTTLATVAPHASTIATPDFTSSPWPQPISPSFQADCLARFRAATDIAAGPSCAVCARRTFTQDMLFTKSHLSTTRMSRTSVHLEILRISDPHLLERSGDHFIYNDSALNGLALHRDGLHFGTETELDICQECLSALRKVPASLPKYALANDNIRGFLPPDLQDCTWFEERLVAPYLASAYLVKLYDFTSATPDKRSALPRILKGHTCAFPLNVPQTALKLPWAVGEDNALVSCVIIGPRAPRQQDLRGVFSVRRRKVLSLLLFLRQNFKDYPQFEVDQESLDQLPEDDVPELLMRHVIHSECGDVPSLFDQETTGIEGHPALVIDNESSEASGATYLEHHGLMDVNGIAIPAHLRMAAGLANATGSGRPDLLVKHGSQFVKDYNNPALFPGMFPLLFPWGTGGFESERSTRLGFDDQVQYLLDLEDHAFRRHWSFIFVAANIQQRRAIHLGSNLATRSRDYARISEQIMRLDVETVDRITQHMAAGGSMQTLIGPEKDIFALLKKCELTSVQVPGSKAIMNKARADIRGLIGEFGIFHLFITLNPRPEFSPVFQIFFGDTRIDASLRSPIMPDEHTRSVRVADDPIAASDYFHFHICAVLQYLFGWDVRNARGSVEGGILGHVSAFFMVKEHTMRGQLHGHCLVWLKGGLNPRELRSKMIDDESYRQQYLEFFDKLIVHHLPGRETELAPGGTHVSPNSTVCSDQGARSLPPPSQRVTTARMQRAPDPSDPDYAQHFREDHRLLGELLQRHKHKVTCYKGGRKDCRFGFPHQLCEEPVFDPDTRSIFPRVLDANVNWHNPTLLVATRHNHDIKSVQSGKSSAAAASYITSYTTKSDETPANQVAMIRTAFQRMEANGELHQSAKHLVTKCVMQFGRERQLHAQQVATYVRQLGDVFQSHKTVPMLSGAIISKVHRMYGRPSIASNLVADDGNDENVSPTEEEEDCHGDSLLSLSKAGYAHQVDDYLFRGQTLSHVTFYEFVKHAKFIKKPKKSGQNHFPLHPEHPNAATHAHRYDPAVVVGVPRAIYSKFPRSDGTPAHGDMYCSAMLAHFKPFSASNPLKTASQTYVDAFATTEFAPFAKAVMSNWEALVECDDARDQDQLLRRKREVAKSTALEDGSASGIAGLGADLEADIDAAALQQLSKRSLEALHFLASLTPSAWFETTAVQGRHIIAVGNTVNTPVITAARKRRWNTQMADIERMVIAEGEGPRASHGILAQDLGLNSHFHLPTTTLASDDASSSQRAVPDQQPSAEFLQYPPSPEPHVLIQTLIDERSLNEAQALAFKIVARHFFRDLYGQPQPPLRLLMHGAAGTGKTVVVRLLRELLHRYGKAHEIKFVAPTGKAASAIGGLTQHSAFKLYVRQRDLATEDLIHMADDGSASRVRFLQETFRTIRWIFIDEISMTSCEVMSDIDQALRIGTLQLDQPFGGVNVIMAGDLCQLPPVAAASLCTQTSSRKLKADARTKVELGRAAWLQIQEVVDFTQQMRMKDERMAQLLARLRVRECTQEDVQLLNTRVLKSNATPDGVSLAGDPDAIILAKTNETVRKLNAQKARTQADSSSKALVLSHALDTSPNGIDSALRQTLLRFDGPSKHRSGLARVPLFLGMPVVYRGANLSVPMGVTNGAFATVAGWDLAPDDFGLTVPRCVLLKINTAVPWQLEGLPPNCLPIYPSLTKFKFASEQDGRVHSISRKQLPIQPAYSMTVHSAQGITSESGVVVNLRSGGFEGYVAASRATHQDRIFLTCPVALADLNTPQFPLALKQELVRIGNLADSTRLEHAHDNWRLLMPHKRAHDADAPAGTPAFKRTRTS